MPKPNIVSTLGFRTDCQDLFKYEIEYKQHLKHQTPYIFFLDGVAEALYYTREVLSRASDEDIVFKSWVGKWKTDVFAIRVKELREFIEKNEIRII